MLKTNIPPKIVLRKFLEKKRAGIIQIIIQKVFTLSLCCCGHKFLPLTDIVFGHMIVFDQWNVGGNDSVLVLSLSFKPPMFLLIFILSLFCHCPKTNMPPQEPTGHCTVRGTQSHPGQPTDPKCEVGLLQLPCRPMRIKICGCVLFY